MSSPSSRPSARPSFLACACHSITCFDSVTFHPSSAFAQTLCRFAASANTSARLPWSFRRRESGSAAARANQSLMIPSFPPPRISGISARTTAGVVPARDGVERRSRVLRGKVALAHPQARHESRRRPGHVARTVASALQIHHNAANPEAVAGVVGRPQLEVQPAQVAEQSAEHLRVRLDLELDGDGPRFAAHADVLEKRHRVAGPVRLAGESESPSVEPPAKAELFGGQVEQPGQEGVRLQFREVAARLIVGSGGHDRIAWAVGFTRSLTYADVLSRGPIRPS